MAENSTLARPYAQAAFQLAKAQGNLAGWSDELKAVAAVVADKNAKVVLSSPRLTKDQVTSVVVDVCGDALDEQGKNFVKLLVENARLSLMPEIVEAYEKYRAESEARIEAEVISAFELNDKQKSDIAAALKKRTGRDVTLSVKVDSALIGGAIIKAGDLVIDGSVSGKLEKLGSALRN
jgi:F-type H+-transporting ATPase subunit delta